MTAGTSPQPDAGPLPLVSVCILSWNTRELVKRNLQTLYSQPADFDFETIVVDNASEDGSADMVAAEFPQVRLLRQSENLMFAKGMNTGARAARGQFLLFLNSDCFITPATLGCMIEFLQTHPRAMIAGARQVRGDGSIDASLKLCPGLARTIRRLFFLSAGWSARKLREGDHGQPIQAPMLPGSCVLARRELIDNPGLFDERFTLGVEDSDLSFRVVKAGYEVWFLPQCEVIHLHAQSRSKLSRADRERPMVEGAALFCRKHYSLPYRRVLAVVESLLLLRDTLGILIVILLTLGTNRKARQNLSGLLVRAGFISALWRKSAPALPASAAPCPGAEQPCRLCGGGRTREMSVTGNGSVWRQCCDCGLWVNVTPLGCEVAAYYDAEYHQSHYGARRRRKARTARLIIRQLEALAQPGKLLDIGCSVGHLLQAAADGGWDAWGVDVNPEVVARCRELGLQVEVAAMSALPFADATFDAVQARHVLEHDAEVARNLAEMWRVLKPGGLLVIEVPDCASPKVTRRGARYSKFWTCDHMVGFTLQTLEAFARQAGFEPVSLRPFAGLREGRSGDPVSFLLWRAHQISQHALGRSKAFSSVWLKPAR